MTLISQLPTEANCMSHIDKCTYLSLIIGLLRNKINLKIPYKSNTMVFKDIPDSMHFFDLIILFKLVTKIIPLNITSNEFAEFLTMI